MTTILYHDGMLLTDSRRSIKSCNEHRHCAHCGESEHTVTDHNCKIRMPRKGETAVFRGENIRAISGAGVSNEVSKQVSAFFELDNYEQSLRQCFTYFATTKEIPTIPVTLLMVTDKSVYVIDYNKPDFYYLDPQRYELTDTVAIGSGGLAAKTAIIAYGEDPFEAMRVASVVDKSTGGPTRYVDFSQEELKIMTYEPLVVEAPEKPQVKQTNKAIRAPRYIKKPITE